MLELYEIKDWLKTIKPKFQNYYMGKLDAKKDKSLGVYNLKTRQQNQMALGGLSNTKTAVKGVSLLVHYNNNARETENASIALFEELNSLSSFDINDKHIKYIQLLNNEPISVDSDDKGIYEYVIEFNIFYERRI